MALLAPMVAFAFDVCRAQEAPPEVLSGESAAESVESLPPSSDEEGDAGEAEPAPWVPEESATEAPASIEADSSSEGAEEDSGPSRVEPSSRGGARPSDTLSEPLPPSSPEPPRPMGDLIVEVAQKYLGYRYVWGGSSPRTGFDCSGFTYYVYMEAGIRGLPRDLGGQLNAGPRIGRDQLQPGDLVFFQNTYRWGLSHSGIYLGDSRFIHAVEPGVGVGINSLNEGFWSGRFVGASRPWPPPGG